MYHWLMIGMFPEQRIVRTGYRNDVIDVTVLRCALLATATRTDARHAEVFLSIVLPLVSIASTCCAWPGVLSLHDCTRMLSTLLPTT